MDKVIKQLWAVLHPLRDFYAKHEWYQFVLLIPLAIIAFLYGRHQQDKQFENSLERLNNTDNYQLELGKSEKSNFKRLSTVRRILKSEIIVFGLGVVLTCAYYLMSLRTLIPIPKYVAGVVGLGMGVVMGCTFLVRKLLEKQMEIIFKERANVRDQEKEDVNKLLRHLGDNIVKKLKKRFEKNITDDEERKLKEKCSNASCQRTTSTLREANQVFQRIVKKIGSFEWCPVCRTQLTSTKEYPKETPLQTLKPKNSSLQQMKIYFNHLLQWYTQKQAQLESTCPIECSKSFFQKLKQIHLQFEERESSYNSRLGVMS